MSGALLEAGERLAEAMRLGLSAQGLPCALEIVQHGHKVVIGSRSTALLYEELGRAGRLPKAVMEGAARQAAPLALQALIERLGSVGQ